MSERIDGEFTTFVNERGGVLLRTAYALAGSQHGAEDLLQTALAKAYARWSRIRGEPEPYVRQILYRDQVSGWRRRSRRPEFPVAVPPDSVGRPDRGHEVDLRLLLREALLALPPRQRAVLTLRRSLRLAPANRPRAGPGRLGSAVKPSGTEPIPDTGTHRELDPAPPAAARRVATGRRHANRHVLHAGRQAHHPAGVRVGPYPGPVRQHRRVRRDLDLAQRYGRGGGGLRPAGRVRVTRPGQRRGPLGAYRSAHHDATVVTRRQPNRPVALRPTRRFPARGTSAAARPRPRPAPAGPAPAVPP